MADDSTQSTLTIRILGRDYPITCPDNEREALLSSAQQLSQRMQSIQKKGKTLGVDRIAVMAALNIAHESQLLREEVEQLRQQVRQAPAEADDTQPRQQDADDAARDERLSKLQVRINSALDGSS